MWDSKSWKSIGISSHKTQVQAKPLIILEGMYSFSEEISKYIDLKIYLDIEPETAQKRGFERDVLEYGLDPNQSKKNWHRWLGEHNVLVHKCKNKADIIVSTQNGGYEIKFNNL